jgi:hypothetical protein
MEHKDIGYPSLSMGIYVRWLIFVKPQQATADAPKEKLFNSTQEAARKCVE